MSDDLPEDYDLVVIGTGFTESCVAAAASRIGKSVLHLDQNDFYGGAWASFSLENLIEYFENNVNPEVTNCKYQWHIDNEVSEEKTDQICQKTLLDQSRRFSIDLSPRILFSAGHLVQLLITSNICRYAEFRAVDRVCTLYNDEILSVPCSRSDVFNSRELGVVEKRMLMKFLNSCMTFGEDKYHADFLVFKDKTFVEFLHAQKLTEKIQKCIIQAIAMCKDDTSFDEGIEKTLKFLKSIGRYGNTPFLFPMYGCGEIPQCFCRLCAVFGGIYCLNKKIDSIQIPDDQSELNIITEGKVLHAKHIVASFGNIKLTLNTFENPVLSMEPIKNRISRGIIISKTPLGNEDLNSGCGGVTILRMLHENREAFFIQLSHYSGTCPREFYMFHFICPAVHNDPKEDLKPFLEQTLQKFGIEDSLLFSAFFSITECNLIWNDSSNIRSLLSITEPPCFDMDYDKSIEDAQIIFSNLYPEQDFLPRAPDPEEIVVDGEDPIALTESSLPEDLREHFRHLQMEQNRELIENEQNMDEE